MYDTDRLPPELRPLSPWTYFGLDILYAIPLIGFIFLICHAIGSTNVNKRNFACSFFCIYVVVVAVVLLYLLLIAGAGAAMAGALGDLF